MKAELTSRTTVLERVEWFIHLSHLKRSCTGINRKASPATSYLFTFSRAHNFRWSAKTSICSMVRICGQCHQQKSGDEFTKSQWSKGDRISRCNRCVEGYHCPHCNKQFIRPRPLELHIKKRHPVITKVISPPKIQQNQSLLKKKLSSADLIWLFRRAPKWRISLTNIKVTINPSFPTSEKALHVCGFSCTFYWLEIHIDYNQ